MSRIVPVARTSIPRVLRAAAISFFAARATTASTAIRGAAQPASITTSTPVISDLISRPYPRILARGTTNYSDASGAVVMPEAEEAVCWCVRGALRQVALMALRPYDAESRNRTLLLVEIAARHVSTTLMREFGVGEARAA